MGWYYYSDFNEKIGPFSVAKLIELVKSGIVRRDTVIENTNGRSVFAEEVQGIVFPVQSQVVFDTLPELCENSEEESVFRIFMRDNLWGLRKAWSVVYPILCVISAALVKAFIGIYTVCSITLCKLSSISSNIISFLVYTLSPRPKSFRRLSPMDISFLDPLDFEKYVASLFRAKGYRTKLTPRTGDGGVDIYAERDTERVIIQCKHRSDPTKTVPISDVRELAGVFLSTRDEKRLTKAILVTNGRFTDGTRKEPSAKRIELIDGKRLRKL